MPVVFNEPSNGQKECLTTSDSLKLKKVSKFSDVKNFP